MALHEEGTRWGSLVLSIALSIGPPSFAQVVEGSGASRMPDPDWETVANAAQGSHVAVSLRDGSEVKGRVVVVRPEAIVLDDVQTGRSGVRTPAASSLRRGVTLQRTDIARIEMLSPARATPGMASTFEQLSVLVAPGERVTVTDNAGRQASGTVAKVSSSQLSVKVGDVVRTFLEGEVLAVRQRRSDSLGNGALWGLGVGAGLGVAQCGACHVGPGLVMGMLYGGAGAGIGIAIDALIKKEMVIYRGSRDSARTVTIAPQLAPSHQSVAVRITF